ANFQPNGNLVVSASADGQVWIRSDQGNSESKPTSLKGEVYSAAVTEKLIALARGDNGISIIDWTGQSVCEAPGSAVGSVISVGFSQTGLLAAGTDDGRVSIIDSPCSSEPKTFQAHVAAVTSIAFHPGDDRFATGSLDHTIRIWDRQGQQVGPALLGHDAGVQAVVFHPSGTFLVSASAARPTEQRNNNTVRLWDFDGGLLIAARDLGQPGSAIAFSHDGSLIATSSGQSDGNLRVGLFTSSGSPITV